MTLKNRLARIRKNRGMKQIDLSAASGVGRSTISNIETNRYIPGIDTALMLARALRCHVEDIFILEE